MSEVELFQIKKAQIEIVFKEIASCSFLITVLKHSYPIGDVYEASKYQ